MSNGSFSHEDHTEFASRIDLTRAGDLSPLTVDMESFFEFSFWIAEELSDLVATYQLFEESKKSVSTLKRQSFSSNGHQNEWHQNDF